MAELPVLVLVHVAWALPTSSAELHIPEQRVLDQTFYGQADLACLLSPLAVSLPDCTLSPPPLLSLAAMTP